MAKYLLSTGNSTDKIELYIIDLFRLYLKIYPKDIPGMPDFGFNFIMTNVMKSELKNELVLRINNLVNNISERFKSGIDIELVSVNLIDEKLAKIVISVNRIVSDEIELNIYE